jgi:DNA-binding NarL/FixJ family response regulator
VITEYRTLRDLLTRRELSVVALLVTGCSNRQIARALKLTDHTIKNYLFTIFDKVGCDNRVTLAVRYVREEECERKAPVGQVGYVEHAETVTRL